MTKASLLVLTFLLAGCSSLGYYSQAVGGHLGVMLAARPINEVIDDPTCDPVLKNKLEEVRRIRDFASRELGLPDNGSYRTYADLQRPFVAWNVFAAPEFSLQTENWCMFIVGCVGYRGFFNQQEAELLASELRQRGFDTYIGGIPAYSTLGYFNDPVLNTFLKNGNIEVARHIFHELAHQVLYVAGDTVFNESFATAVENEGLRRWLEHTASPELRHLVTAQQQRRATFVGLVNSYHDRLHAIYASNLSHRAKRHAKAEVMAEIKHHYLSQQAAQGNSPFYRQWLELDLNNAKLASLAFYTQRLPAFEALLAEEAYNLPRFYRRVALLGGLPYLDREAELKRLQTAAVPVNKLATSPLPDQPIVDPCSGECRARMDRVHRVAPEQ